MLKNLVYIKQLLSRISIAFVLYSLCRLLFLLFNPSLFSYGFADLFSAFCYGILYDSSAIIYTNGIFIFMHLIPIKQRDSKWYQNFLKLYFLIINSVAVLINLADSQYFKFSGKRSGIEVLALKDDFIPMLGSYMADFWFVPFLVAIFVWIMLFFYKKTYFSQAKEFNRNGKFIALELVVMLLGFGLSLIGVRGGLQMVPISSFDAARQTRAELAPLVINTPFQLIVSSQQGRLKEQHYFSDEVAKKYFNPIVIPNTAKDATKPNMVLIIVESLGKEYIGYYNHGKGYTPFLDSLMKHSRVYQHAYANGKRSIEGVPSSIMALPSLMDNDYISSVYQSNTLFSTAYYLQKLGYQSGFYHGGKNGTMSFDNMAAISQAGKYFGLNEYPDQKDFDGKWGIYDKPYLQYFAEQCTEAKQPFYKTVFTLSNHHPYSLPPNEIGKYAECTLPIHKTVRYTDEALREFFSTANKQSWFKNTVFIITADHSAENEKAYYQSSQGKYEIPLIVFDARLENGFEALPDTMATVQQLSIMPMILNMIGVNNAYFSFGSYASGEHFAMQRQDGYYQFIQYPYVYHFDGSNGLGFFDLSKDSLMNNNHLKNPQCKESVHHLDTLAKSFIQQYNAALIHNMMRLK